MSRDKIPKSDQLIPIKSPHFVNTVAGKMQVKWIVRLRDVWLPEFDKNKSIDELKALVYDQPCRYDIILGSDFLHKIGVDINYKTKEVTWYGDTIPLRNARDFNAEDLNALVKCFSTQIDEDTLGDERMDS